VQAAAVIKGKVKNKYKGSFNTNTHT